MTEHKVHDIDLDTFRDAIMGDSYDGICLDCGEIQGGVEPDAEHYHCEGCGANQVCGIELAAIGGRITVDGDIAC